MHDRPLWYPYDDTVATHDDVGAHGGGGSWSDPLRPAHDDAGHVAVASFVPRAVAVVIDGLVLMVLGIAGLAAIWSGTLTDELAGVVTGWMVVATVLMLWGVPLLYEVIGIGLFGRTLGKAALGLRVTRPDGTTPIGLPRSLGRWFAKIVSAMTFYIGYLMPLWDRERRALHDTMVDTRVALVRESTLERSRSFGPAVTLQLALLVGVPLGLAAPLVTVVPDGGWDMAELTAPPLPDAAAPADDAVGTSRRRISVLELRTGDCFDISDLGLSQTVDWLPCDQPHDAQVFAIRQIPSDAVDGSDPTDEALGRAAEEICMAATATVSDPQLEVFSLHPTTESWSLGDQEVACMVTASQGKLTAPLMPPQRT
jgi:uncharacterized RDD family membrane protein YckC